MENKYYIDEIYHFTAGYAIKGFSIFLSYIERFIVGGLVSTVTSSIEGLGKIGSKLQTGQVQQYGMIAFLGLAVLLVIFASGYGIYKMNVYLLSLSSVLHQLPARQ